MRPSAPYLTVVEVKAKLMVALAATLVAACIAYGLYSTRPSPPPPEASPEIPSSERPPTPPVPPEQPEEPEEQRPSAIEWSRANVRAIKYMPAMVGRRYPTYGLCEIWNWSNPDIVYGGYYIEVLDSELLTWPDLQPVVEFSKVENYTVRLHLKFHFEFWVGGRYLINITTWVAPGNDTYTSKMNFYAKILNGTGPARKLSDVYKVQVNVTGASKENPYIYEFEVSFYYPLDTDIWPFIQSPPYWLAVEVWRGEERAAG